MVINVKSYSTTASLLNSIIFLIIGATLMMNPDSIITWISYAIGGLLSLIGLFKLISYYRIKKKTEIVSNGDLIFGTIFITLGISCFFLANIFELIIRFLIGAWILFSGIQRLIDTLKIEAKTKSNIRFIALLIVSIILIALGLYIILYSNLLFKWIGLLMVIYSIVEIVGYVFFAQENKLNDNKENNKKDKKSKPVIIEHKEKD